MATEKRPPLHPQIARLCAFGRHFYEQPPADGGTAVSGQLPIRGFPAHGWQHLGAAYLSGALWLACGLAALGFALALGRLEHSTDSTNIARCDCLPGV